MVYLREMTELEFVDSDEFALVCIRSFAGSFRGETRDDLLLFLSSDSLALIESLELSLKHTLIMC